MPATSVVCSWQPHCSVSAAQASPRQSRHSHHHSAVIKVDRPALAHPKDVILKVTSTAICGSDLHLYTGAFPKSVMQRGDILGHEFMGTIHEVGDDVKGA